jgi:hypothetical protein
MHNIVGGLFRLTTRFCSLIDVRDLVKEVNYDTATPFKKIMSSLNIFNV